VNDAAVHEHGSEKSIQFFSIQNEEWDHSIIQYSLLKRIIPGNPEEKENNNINYYENSGNMRRRLRRIFIL